MVTDLNSRLQTFVPRAGSVSQAANTSRGPFVCVDADGATQMARREKGNVFVENPADEDMRFDCLADPVGFKATGCG